MAYDSLNSNTDHVNKVKAILGARERHGWEVREKSQEKKSEARRRLEKVIDEEEKLKLDVEGYYGKQKDLERLVESLNEKVQKLETQPVGGKGFITSSAQNLSGSFGNLTTSFKVKADLDLGKFSGMEPVPSNELTFDQWTVDVRSYQMNVPDHILLPAICKSIIGKAQSVIRTLEPNYTMEDVIKCLSREYEGVASSDVVFKEFYQLKQERGEKVQIFSIRLRDAIANVFSRFPERVPGKDHESML